MSQTIRRFSNAGLIIFSYGIVGNQELPVLKYVLEHFLGSKAAGTVSVHIKHLMAETLLAASTFSDFDWKYKALTIAEGIILTDLRPLPNDLGMYAAINAISTESKPSRCTILMIPTLSSQILIGCTSEGLML